jgi:dsRNA-specific ribonuclease
LGQNTTGEGKGKSKKIAEQNAALKALQKLKNPQLEISVN